MAVRDLGRGLAEEEVGLDVEPIPDPAYLDALAVVVIHEVGRDEYLRGLVDEPSFGRPGLGVGHGLVDERERIVEGPHDLLDLVHGGLVPLASLGSFLADALLLGGEDIVVDESLVRELNELLLLGLEVP